MKGRPIWQKLKKGTHRFCVCGKSASHPICNGSHPPGQEPITFEVEKDDNYMLCGCGKTRTPPYCDGSHLPQDQGGFDEYL